VVDSSDAKDANNQVVATGTCRTENGASAFSHCIHDRTYAWLAVATLVVALMVVLLTTAAGAQVVGAILTGTITDPTGAAALNATVTIRNVETGIVSVTQTNAAGIYSTPNLLPGEYTISAEAPGLTSGESPTLTLPVGEMEILNIQMRVTNLAEIVNVHASAGTVELGNAAISHVVDGRAARELPLNGRGWTDLAVLQPGVSLIRTQPDANGVNNRGNRGFGSQLTPAPGHSRTTIASTASASTTTRIRRPERPTDSRPAPNPLLSFSTELFIVSSLP
jgi:Carboxypeptidase regulatory-like domain